MNENGKVMLGIFGGPVGAWQAMCYLPVGWNIIGVCSVILVATYLIFGSKLFRSH